MKKWLRILAKVLAAILIAVLASVAAMQSPKVQAFAGKKVAGALSKHTDADITFLGISIRPFEAITLDHVVVIDRNPVVPGTDTLARIGTLSAKFSVTGLLYGTGAYISSARLDGALFQLVTEPAPGTQTGTTTNLARVFGLKENPEKKSGWGNILYARSLSVSNSVFRLINPVGARKMEEKGIKTGKIDFNNLDVSIHKAGFSRIKVADNYIIGTVNGLSATENRSHYRIEKASASRVVVGNGGARIYRLALKDNHSDLRLARLKLTGPLSDYSDFVEKIHLAGEFREGTLFSMQTATFFAPALDHVTFRGELRGKVEGLVNDFLLKDVSVKDLDNNLSVRVSGRVMNVTDMSLFSLDLKVKEVGFTFRGLDGFLGAWSPEGSGAGLRAIAPGEYFAFSGSVRGLINRLGVKGSLTSRLGSAKADVTLRNTLDQKRPIIIGGEINTSNLNAGRIAGIDAIGPVTLGTSLTATLPRSGTPQVEIDTLRIDRLSALGYDYSGISASGSYTGDSFNGTVKADDPNLNFLFQGRLNLAPGTRDAVYRFDALLGHADLHALNIDKRPVSRLAFQASANFTQTVSRDLAGDVTVSGITLESATGVHNLGDLGIRARANGSSHRIDIASQFIDGYFQGDKAIFDFITDLKSLVLDRDLPALSQSPSQTWDGAAYNLSLRITKAQDLLDFLAPGAYVANPTQIALEVTPAGAVLGNVVSGRIALREKFIKDINLVLNSYPDVMRASVTGSSIQLSEGVRLLDSRLSLFADDNRIGLGYSFDNSAEDATKAELILRADLSRDYDGLAVCARALPSNLYYKGDGWGITSGDILIKGGDFLVEKLRATHEDELLEVDGGFSSSARDTLNVRMEKFNLGIISTFTGGGLDLAGQASGNAVVISPSEPFPGIEAGIVCDSTMISGHRVGSLLLGSNWDAGNKRFNIGAFNLLDGKTTLDADGYFVPQGQKIKAEVNLDRFQMAYASSLFAGLFSTFDGCLSGSVKAEGPLKNLDLSSRDLKVEDGHIALDFTRAVYGVSGDLALDREAIHFNGLRLTDAYSGSARVQGDVTLGNFKNLGTAIHIDLDRIRALDLRKGENPTLYGVLPVSGSVDVNGPLTRLVVDINATTSGPGELHLPIGSSSGEREKKMLAFTQPPNDLEQDPYELMMALGNKKQTTSSNLAVNLTAHATQNATVFIDIGENTLQGKGEGTVGVSLDVAQGGFGLSGDYTLREGSFKFSAMNLVSRDFNIKDGSSVRFNGPVNETDLSVTGQYITKASLANIMPSTSEDADASGGSMRTVICGLDITGKLKNPELKFSIDIPDLNPGTWMEIEPAFSTEDKVQKQFLYLLIAGSFLPEDDAGITNAGSNMLYSNVSSIMSGQINNILSKLNIPVDLGLNYQNQSGRNMFDVAVSTQLFHNRVIVNGAVGNKQKIGSTSSEVTGDIDVEIKLNRSGTLRTTLFSHSADQFSTYLDNSQRNGAGISFQREFGPFRSKDKGMEIIQIDSTGKAHKIAEDE